MADRRNNNAQNSSANLLFSDAPEFNFNLPFLPVSQTTGPVGFSGGECFDRVTGAENLRDRKCPDNS